MSKDDLKLVPECVEHTVRIGWIWLVAILVLGFGAVILEALYGE